ncbi:MAG: radical SAM protein [Bacteroidetes bacterium]|nr:MAG: radical SAM protein [Bacteroidota bacterium]
MESWEGKTRGGVLGYKIFVWTLRNLGIPFAYFLLVFVVSYFMVTSGKAFRAVYRYFRERMNYNMLRSLMSIYRNYYVFGQILVDKLALLAGFQHKFTFDFEGEEYLRQMDKGGLLISGHVGNWEIAGQLLVRLEKKINILMYDAEHRKIKGYLADVLQRNVHFIVIREDYSHLQEIKEAFSRGEIIAMHGDRYIEGNKTVITEFLGKPAAFPMGPVNLAARFNVPAAYVFAVKETNSHYHFYSSPLQYIDFSNNLKKRDAILSSAVKKFVDAFEAIVYKYPLQWFNYYDFWKLPETDHKQPGSENRETSSAAIGQKEEHKDSKKKISRRLLLVSANQYANPYPVYPLGLSYLYAYLSDRMPDLDIRSFDFNLHGNEELKSLLLSYKPDYTGLSLRNIDDVNFYTKESFVGSYKAIGDIIRESGNCTKFIVGGSAFSIYPVELFGLLQPDFGISGEGEDSLFKLLQSLDKGTPDLTIPGLVYRENGVLMQNTRQQFIKTPELSFEPEMVNFYWQKSGMINIQTKRGCPFNCIYCTYPLIEGHNVRTLDPDRILHTLRDLYYHHNVDYYFFTDSVFNISNNFNIELAEKIIKSNMKLKWGAYFSPYNLTKDLLELFARAGLTHIEFGTESLSDATLKAYGKHFNADDVVAISQYCNDVAIYFCHFMIIGGYGETDITVDESFENSKRIENTVFFPYVGMRIYPGTKLHELSIAEGVLAADDPIIQPVYYLSKEVNYETLRKKAESSGRRWVFADEDVATAMNRLRSRNRKGSLWHHLKK